MYNKFMIVYKGSHTEIPLELLEMMDKLQMHPQSCNIDNDVAVTRFFFETHQLHDKYTFHRLAYSSHKIIEIIYAA